MIVKQIELHEVRPEAADLRRIEHLRTERATVIPDVSYIVKVYIDNMPPPKGSGYHLFVGDREIRKYAQFKNGMIDLKAYAGILLREGLTSVEEVLQVVSVQE